MLAALVALFSIGLPAPATWSCSGPRVLQSSETLKVSAAGFKFSPPDGTGAGGAEWSGIKNSYAEGEKVSITLTATNMQGGFTALGFADGRLYKEAKDPEGQKSVTIDFTFKPEPGRTEVTFVVDMHTTKSSWQHAQRGSLSWTFTPGPGTGGGNTDVTSGPAGELHATDGFEVPAGSQLLHGKPFVDREVYSYLGGVVKGVVADGVSLLVLSSKVDGPGTAAFTVSGAGGALYPLTGTVPIKSAGPTTLETPVETSSGGNYTAIALYRPPSYFGKGSEAKKITFSVKFKAKDATAFGQASKATIDLVRPPVVLVHGTYDNPKYCYKDHEDIDDAPTNLGPLLENLGFNVSYLDWEEWNGMKNPSSFQYNRKRVWEGVGGIKQAVEAMRRDHIAVTQADVVCHSQGGMIVRTYCRGYDFETSMPPDSVHYRNPYDCHQGSTACFFHRDENMFMGDIHRLITISSTHRGSSVCNVFKTLSTYPDQTLAQNISKLFINVFLVGVDKVISGITSDGFLNQIPDSLELQLIGPTPVASHAIACVATDEDTRDVRTDSMGEVLKGSVLGKGNYWNKFYKVWLGTTDGAREFLFVKLAALAGEHGMPNPEGELAEYRRRNDKVRLISDHAMKPMDDLVFQMRKIVFQGDENDCTVAMTSSYGGLKPPYTFKAEHALHGWAPRYKHVQKRVVEVLCDDGGLLDPDGFPGYTGIKSQASTFMTPIAPQNITEPTDTGNTGNTGNTGTQGAGKDKPPVSGAYLKRLNTTVTTDGIDKTKWTIDEKGVAIMRQHWGTAKFTITTPEYIPQTGATEVVFEVEATPVPGQRMSVGLTFRGDEVKRDPWDRECTVYVESGATAVTKKERKVWKVSMLENPQPGYRLWVTMTDGPSFLFAYTPATGGAPDTKPDDPPKTDPPAGGGAWAGTWDTLNSLSIEPLILTQSGSDVTGTYAAGKGRLKGKVEGKILKFALLTATGVESCRGELKLSDDGSTFEGTFIMLGDPDKTPIGLSARRVKQSGA